MEKSVSFARKRKSEPHLVSHCIQQSGGKSDVKLHKLRVLKGVFFRLGITIITVGSLILSVTLNGMRLRGWNASDIGGGDKQR